MLSALEGSVLARYFLHIVTLDGSRIEDQEGYNLPDLAAARREALAGTREIIAHAIRSGRDFSDKAIVITDGHGQELERVDFIEAIPAGLRARLR